MATRSAFGRGCWTGLGAGSAWRAMLTSVEIPCPWADFHSTAQIVQSAQHTRAEPVSLRFFDLELARVHRHTDYRIDPVGVERVDLGAGGDSASGRDAARGRP